MKTTVPKPASNGSNAAPGRLLAKRGLQQLDGHFYSSNHDESSQLVESPGDSLEHFRLQTGHDFTLLTPHARNAPPPIDAVLRRSPWVSTASSPLPIQAKLKVNIPGDEYEQEADRVSEKIMRMPEPQVEQPFFKTNEYSKYDDKNQRVSNNLQRLTTSTAVGSAAPPIINSVLNSQGLPLPTANRTFMESRFGQDFGDVRVHTDQRAAESAAAVHARAYTVGHNIVFGLGENPMKDQRLLAHELTHVVQQSNSNMNCTVQRFEGPEHMRIGAAGWQERIPLPNYPEGLLYEEIVALAGDFFGTFEELQKAKKEDIDRILIALRQQSDLYKKAYSSSLARGEEQAKAIEAGKDAAYGTGMNLTLDQASSGRYLDLAGGRENLSHFSDSDKGSPSALNNIERYSAEHAKAIQAALAGRADEARARDGFAAHYLTDRFASGHLRAEVNALAPERKRQHDRDNEQGLLVENERGDSWMSYGDGSLDASEKNLQIAQEAVRRSQEDIETALHGTFPQLFRSNKLTPYRATPFRALQLVPWPSDKKAPISSPTIGELFDEAKVGLGLIIKSLPIIGPAFRGAVGLVDSLSEDDRARDTAALGTSDMPISRRVLLVKQLLSGFTGDDDEQAIIKIFSGVLGADQDQIAAGASLERIYSAVDGEELHQLINVLRPMYREWSTERKLEHLRKRLKGWTREWEEDVCLTILEVSDPLELKKIVDTLGRRELEDELGGSKGRLHAIFAYLPESTLNVQPNQQAINSASISVQRDLTLAPAMPKTSRDLSTLSLAELQKEYESVKARLDRPMSYQDKWIDEVRSQELRNELAQRGKYDTGEGESFALGISQQGRPVNAYYFSGQTEERALVIGGVHGSELSGIEVAELLVANLKTAKSKPYYTVIVVPVLFPDNRALAESRPKSIGTAENLGRYTIKGRKQGKDPNRQMPALGKAFDSKNPVDAKGVRIEPENVMLLELIDRFKPSRIASVHATRPEKGKDASGIYADPKTNESSIALGVDDDAKLAIRMAEHAKKGGASVVGNALDSKPTALYPLDAPFASKGKPQTRKTDEGTSLGGWGTTAIKDGRPAMTVITIEVRTSNPSLVPKEDESLRDPARLKELQAHAISIQEIFLGPP